MEVWSASCRKKCPFISYEPGRNCNSQTAGSSSLHVPRLRRPGSGLLPCVGRIGCWGQSFRSVPFILVPKGTCCPAALAFAHIPRVTCNSHLPWNSVLPPPWLDLFLPKPTHWVTPPKPFSTTKAVIFSFTAPVAASVIGVLAKTVKICARPPLLWKNEGNQGMEDREW